MAGALLTADRSILNWGSWHKWGSYLGNSTAGGQGLTRQGALVHLCCNTKSETRENCGRQAALFFP